MILRRYLRELDVCGVCKKQSCPDGRYDGEREENRVLAPDAFGRFAEAESHSLGEAEVSALEAIS